MFGSVKLERVRRRIHVAAKYESHEPASNYEFFPISWQQEAFCVRVLQVGRARPQRSCGRLICLYTPDMDFLAGRTQSWKNWRPRDKRRVCSACAAAI
jgi:hypothetical protein